MRSSNPAFLRQLYDTEVYHIEQVSSHEKQDVQDMQEPSVHTGGASGIVVLVHKQPTEDEFALLEKILASIGEHVATVELSDQLSAFDPSVKLIIAFGLAVSDQRAIVSVPLAELIDDVDAKKSLWAKLKSR